MQQVMRMFCAMAVLLLGFAHPAPAGATALSATERAQFALPDGSLPDLCLPTAADDDGNGKQLSHSHFCGACRVFWAHLPAPADAARSIARKSEDGAAAGTADCIREVTAPAQCQPTRAASIELPRLSPCHDRS
ncbi:hypothetical protein [Ensifer canadensis]